LFGLLAASAGCTDDLPTLTGEGLFPGGVRPSTFEAVVPAEEYLRTLGRFSGYTGPRDASFFLLANRFDGVLDAHILSELVDFPRSLSFSFAGTQRTDSVFAFLAGSVTATVDSLASEASGPFQVQVWEVGQDFDVTTATWELAVDTVGARVPWMTPGGTRGALLGEIQLASPTSSGDTLRVPLDSLALKRIAADGFRGLLVTASGGGARLEVGNVSVQAQVRPQGADTIINLRAPAGNATFLFTPEPPVPTTAWQAGGIRSARTLLQLDVGLRVPVCRRGVCTDVPLREVTLNEVSLLLEPVPVPLGFRPLGRVPIVLRRIVEPELGRQAPLGEIVNDTSAVDRQSGRLVFAGSLFRPDDSIFAIPITSFVRNLLAGDSTNATLALLGESSFSPVSTFGVAWFSPAPRLRIVYTVPERPNVP
ncbi:MAG: hypothetical protein M3483_04845, partial [Gemmatimonadota bacterium]|nr:hypothetical protein [Gemmatimonadota bacterium]